MTISSTMGFTDSRQCASVASSFLTIIASEISMIPPFAATSQHKGQMQNFRGAVNRASEPKIYASQQETGAGAARNHNCQLSIVNCQLWAESLDNSHQP
jgi:hypothetical protein